MDRQTYLTYEKAITGIICTDVTEDGLTEFEKKVYCSVRHIASWLTALL